MKKLKKIVLMVLAITMFLAYNCQASVMEYDYILDKKDRKIPIPVTYTVQKVFNGFGSAGMLNNAQDLFIDKNDTLYIADTSNNRIVKLDKQGNVLGVFTGGDKKPLKEPKGIYVDDSGDMYVADTGNGRIAHLSSDGSFVEEFVQPKSSLYDSKSPFKPTKVYIDAINRIYALNNDYHGFIVMDANNDFKGYVAPTRLERSFNDVLIRAFATPEQKEKLSKRLPPAHSNFVIHKDGMIYATTLRAKQGQVKKLTTLGNNIYSKKTFFGESIDEARFKYEPSFADLTVSEDGIITALDSASCKLYQYDSEGNLLTVFGGNGTYNGKFLFPSSVVQDKSGNIYVLDSRLNNIQVFTPTKFINTVHKALKLYSEGCYQEAIKPWNDILKMGSHYYVAHMGLGKAYVKQGNWSEAMRNYKIAEDISGYSISFGEFRHEMFRKHFGVIVLLVIVLAVAIVKFVGFIKRKATKWLKNSKTWKGVI